MTTTTLDYHPPHQSEALLMQRRSLNVLRKQRWRKQAIGQHTQKQRTGGKHISASFLQRFILNYEKQQVPQTKQNQN